MSLIAFALATVAAPAAQAAARAPCRVELISSAEGENHVMFHGLSPDGSLLAVGWDKGAPPNVERGAFLLDLKSGARTPLPHLNNAPSFSPEGRFLVSANYTANRTLKTELVELDRQTGRPRTLASGPSAEWLASYSPDGRWVLFNSTRSGNSDLYRIRRADNQLEQLSRDPSYEAHGQFVTGGRILLHRNVAANDYDVAMLDPGNGKSWALSPTPLEEAYPAMSPDGRWIVFSAVAHEGEQPNLYIMPAAGGARRRLTLGAVKDAYASWSPDGRSVYFVRFHEKGSRIYRMAVSRGRCQQG